MSKTTPPTIFCEDFALIPRGAHEGKTPVTFSRPVNLLSAASGEGAAATGKGAQVLVLNLDGQLYIRDLGGTASLQWNGDSTTQANLRHGDKVRLGKIEYDVNATRFTAARPETSPGPTAELIPATGGAAIEAITPVSLVGSSEQAELRLAGGNAPDAMAMILRIGPGYWLWNLEPAFPCRVNGEAVVRVALAEGSVISVGGQEFRFHLRPETATVPPGKVTAKRPVKSPAKPKGASASPAPRKTPAPTPVAAPRAPVAPPISTPQPIAKPDLPAELSVSLAPAIPPPTPLQPAAQIIPPRTPAARAPEEEADVFKQWGPLAFAVAAADRPELQTGGSKPGMSAPNAAASPAPAKPRARRFAIKLIGILLLLAIVTAGAYLAWKHLIAPHRP